MNDVKMRAVALMAAMKRDGSSRSSPEQLMQSAFAFEAYLTCGLDTGVSIARHQQEEAIQAALRNAQLRAGESSPASDDASQSPPNVNVH